MNKEYIIGLIEGEGCFQYHEYERIINHKNGNTYVVKQKVTMFNMGMNLRDEELLKQIQKFIGFGKVYKYKTMTIYSTTSRKEAIMLMDFIDSTSGFKGYKKEQYDQWKEKVLKAEKCYKSKLLKTSRIIGD